MMATPTLAEKESQADACLEVAERYQPQLLALAVKLAGSREGGMDLFQQSLLNCHDAIQRHGFEGERYEFYLRASIKNLHYKETRTQRRISYLEPEAEALPVAAEPDQGAHAQLAEQVAAEARRRFSEHDRLLLRLHADGYSCQEIAALTGSSQDRRRIWERLDWMKQSLRETFAQAWQGLRE
ncbi:MAG: RNA polymerase sigma factor [Janthinobacterium lividum]